MRFWAHLAVLILTACEGSFVPVGDVGRTARTEKTYEVRDACLARNAAADGVSATVAATLAQAAAMACTSETEKLVEAANPGATPKLPRPSVRRAMKYVLQARGRAIF
jgi:hypothetical protein